MPLLDAPIPFAPALIRAVERGEGDRITDFPSTPAAHSPLIRTILFVTKASFVGSYLIPKIDILVAGTFRTDQGASLRAIWNAPMAQVSAALGRPAAVAGTTVPIDLVAPGEVSGDRVNEVNLRVGRILRFGRWRVNAGVDIFNVINANSVLTFNQTFAPGGAWLIPQSVLTPRFVKVSAQIDF